MEYEVIEDETVIAKIKLDKEHFVGGRLPAIIVSPTGTWMAMLIKVGRHTYYDVKPGLYLSNSDFVKEIES